MSNLNKTTLSIKTPMAEVLSRHIYTKPFQWQIGGAMAVCECGDNIYAPLTQAPSDAIARHLAQKLEEAGFGALV